MNRARQLAVFLCVSLLVGSVPAVLGGVQMEDGSGGSDGGGGGGGGDSDPMLSFATDTYDASAEELNLYKATSPTFEDAFGSGYELYLIHELDGWPPTRHTFAWDHDDDEGFDLTTQFPDLVDDSGKDFLTSDQAITVSEAYAETANTRLQLTRDVVYEEDSQRLGYPIEDPTARQIVSVSLDSWNVTLYTWAPTGGLLSKWNVQLRSGNVVHASWEVKKVQAGSYKTPTQHQNQIEVDTRVTNNYRNGFDLTVANGGTQLEVGDQNLETFDYHPVEKRRTFDNSTVRVLWPTNATDIDDEATWGEDTSTGLSEARLEAVALADGLQTAYDTMVYENVNRGNGLCENETNPNPSGGWGFPVNDTDCRLDIHLVPPSNITIAGEEFGGLAGWARTSPSTACEVRILVSMDKLAAYRDEGLFEDPDRHTVSSVLGNLMGHELFHSLQCAKLAEPAPSIDEGDPLPIRHPQWSTFLEGQARFVETLYRPEVNNHTSSMYYDDQQATGANWLVEHPFESTCEHEYSYAPFWGALHGDGGGIDAIERFLEQIANKTLIQPLPDFSAMGAEELLKECNRHVPLAINRTLDNSSDPQHASHGEIVETLGLDLLDRRLRWSNEEIVHNASRLDENTHWALELDLPEAQEVATDQKTVALDDFGGTHLEVQPWGIHYFWLNKARLSEDPGLDSTPELSCDVENPNVWSLRVVRMQAGNASILDNEVVDCPIHGSGSTETVFLDQPEEVYVVAVRQAETPDPNAYGVVLE